MTGYQEFMLILNWSESMSDQRERLCAAVLDPVDYWERVRKIKPIEKVTLGQLKLF